MEGMTTHAHVAVWLDHNEARVFHVNRGGFDETTIASPKAHTQIHRRSGPGAESGHRAEGDLRYYHEVAQALADAEAILIAGPSTAKLELIRYMHKHARALEPKIVGVETVDHPTDRQLAAYVRHYFEAADRVHA
jgi:stalled ribosome rescue protein Dom34